MADTDLFQLIVYVPLSYAETVKAALFKAGAGRYKNYDCCSWQVNGVGQFRALSGADPHVGNIDQLETIEETRLEMLVQGQHAEAVIEALLANHPYEEPAYHLLPSISLSTRHTVSSIGHKP
jgi:hypothetical protein